MATPGGVESIVGITPGKEVDLCGHATLGTAFVLANFYKPDERRFVFETLSERLIVTRKGDLYEMDYF